LRRNSTGRPEKNENSQEMKLYSYWRSTTSYRVRATLNLKGLAYDTVPVDLVAGDQRAQDYVTLNAGKGVPTLVLDDGTVLTQSMAILEYIDATWPAPQLIPSDPLMRAQVMAVAHTVAMDIHPVNNLRLISQFHWMEEGFTALEAMLPDGDSFAFDDAPNIADICITAQVYNAHRWGVDLKKFPKTARIERHCLTVPAIALAHPDKQPDAKVDT